MDVKQFLDMFTWIDACAHREYLGQNPHTHMIEYRWLTLNWRVASSTCTIWNSNHLFKVMPGAYLTYRTIEISSDQFITQLHCTGQLWRWYHGSSTFGQPKMSPLDHNCYVLNWDGDLTEWHTGLTLRNLMHEA